MNVQKITKTKTQTIVRENKIYDFFEFFYNHVFVKSYRSGDANNTSQCCLILLFMIIIVVINIALLFLLSMLFGTVYNIFYHTDDPSFKVGFVIMFFYIVIPSLIMGSLYACFYFCCIIPYIKWKKDLDMRETDLRCEDANV